jgi:hypothetical protein
MAQQPISTDALRPMNDPRTERRAWVRLGSEQEVCCLSATISTKDESESAWLALVLDVSPCGIGLSTKRRFEPGTLLILELSATPDKPSRPFPVRVVHASRELKGRWTIGCAFVSALSQEELQKFLQE